MPQLSFFYVDSSFRVPGLGVLVRPAAPAPSWLADYPLHTAVALALHRPGLPTLGLPATVEELAHDDQPPARVLLLDADPGPLPAGAWLALEAVPTPELW